MMGVAFFGDPDTSGTKAGPGERYIDLRLHRRFGEIFDSLGRYKDAIEEYRLAQCVAQRDVFLLHRLGLALVNDKQYKAAEQVLGDIDLIDPDIARESEEIANLRARFHSKQGQTDEAIGALRAFKHQSESYYVMNNLAIHDMMSEGRITESIRKVFESCREVAQRKAEDDFWARGTLINCLLALGEDAEAERHLNLLRREAGNLREFESATQNCKDILRLRPGGTRGFDLQEATGSGRVHHLKTAGS